MDNEHSYRKIPIIFGVGAALEQVVLYNSTSHFKNSKLNVTREKPCNFQEDEEKSHEKGLWWWNPSEESLPFECCHYSTIHGLPFITRPKLHLSERIFWTIAFVLGVVAAVYLINDVWQRYYRSPVIVAFQENDVDVDTIPFPSVTICSMNAFPKSEFERLELLAKEPDPDVAEAARESLKYVREICHSQLSFSKEFDYAFTRGEDDQLHLGQNDTIENTEDSQNEMMSFLLRHTLPCEDLIRFCMFGEQPMDCGEIFKPMITDYGKCCTFNLLPSPLLLRNHKRIFTKKTNKVNSVVESSSPSFRNSSRWSAKEKEWWQAWDYDKVGFNIVNKSLQRPFRQRRTGMPYGLSLLVDPRINDWYCPVSDSEGFRFLLHNPLETPLVDEFASIFQLNKEIMVEVHPDMTNADDEIRNVQKKSRNCYFPAEYQLKFFRAYTPGNCLTECTSVLFGKRCNCTYYYMPRNDNISICNSDPTSSDYKCINDAKGGLLKTLKKHCGHCESLCEDIEYNFETTMAHLQDPLKLWGDPDPKNLSEKPEWWNNKMSVVHIFFGSDTIVPKLRKKLYGITDLIASTGGLLGLCLGVSVLSAMEVIYYPTLRVFWRVCWKRLAKKRRAQMLKTLHPDSKPLIRERIITFNAHQIPAVHHL